MRDLMSVVDGAEKQAVVASTKRLKICMSVTHSSAASDWQWAMVTTVDSTKIIVSFKCAMTEQLGSVSNLRVGSYNSWTWDVRGVSLSPFIRFQPLGLSCLNSPGLVGFFDHSCPRSESGSFIRPFFISFFLGSIDTLNYRVMMNVVKLRLIRY